jgi:hypothetical protein
MLLLCAACAGGEIHGVPDAGGRSFGRLSIVLAASDDGATVSAVGRLLRYRNLDVDSAQILAGAGGRARAEAAPLGSCALVDDDARLEEALAAASPDSAVQLLDAGEVTIRVAGQAVRMAPRWVPEILPFVSGVMYKTSGEATALPAARATEEALVSAFGGEDVGAFVARAAVPPAPRIGSFAVGEGGATVAWDVAAAPAGTVTVVLARAGGPSLRCRAPDVGRFAIPLPAGSGFTTGGAYTVTVERSARASFRARGLDVGELVVSVRDSATSS